MSQFCCDCDFDFFFIKCPPNRESPNFSSLKINSLCAETENGSPIFIAGVWNSRLRDAIRREQRADDDRNEEKRKLKIKEKGKD